MGREGNPSSSLHNYPSRTSKEELSNKTYTSKSIIIKKMKKILTTIQKEANKILLFTVLAGTIAACDSVLEYDEGDCSIEYCVKFKYDYNMKKEDTFAKEVKNITLYAFDDNNNLVYQKSESGDMLAEEDYAMSLDVEPGDYHIIAWAGLNDDSYAVPLLTPKSSKINDLNVKLLRKSSEDLSRAGSEKDKFIVDQKLSTLWHGELTQSTFTRSGRQRFTEVSLVKNTNNIRVALVQVIKNQDAIVTRALNKDELKFSIYDNNGYMNYDNSLLDDDMLTYKPFTTEQSSVTTKAFNIVATEYPAVIVEMSVARLLQDQNPELSIIDTRTNKSILKTGNLIDYLDLLRVEQYASMPLQEYLDRENQYDISIFVDENLTLLNTVIEINDWVIQLNDFEL